MATQATIGREVTVEIVTPEGNLVIPPDAITAFTFRSNTNDLERRPLNRPRQRDRHPDGYEGSFSIDRTGPEVERWWAQVEADFNRGLRQQRGIILDSTREIDGSVTEFRFEECVFTLTEFGERTANGYISMTIEFTAEGRSPAG